MLVSCKDRHHQARACDQVRTWQGASGGTLHDSQLVRSAYGDGYLRSERPKSLKNSVQSGCKAAWSVANAIAMVGHR